MTPETAARNQAAIEHVARAWSILESGFIEQPDQTERTLKPRQAARMHLAKALELIDGRPSAEVKRHTDLQRIRRKREQEAMG